jgi:hypothetical protein
MPFVTTSSLGEIDVFSSAFCSQTPSVYDSSHLYKLTGKMIWLNLTWFNNHLSQPVVLHIMKPEWEQWHLAQIKVSHHFMATLEERILQGI